MKKWFALSVCLCLLWLPPGTLHAGGKLTLMLDWYPNVDHLPIYLARETGMFAARGLTVDILNPSDTADALKLAASGHADLAVSYEPQALVASAEGLDIRVIGRLVEHPLTTLLFLTGRGIESPGDLEGKRIGYTVPGMMDILLEAFAKINDIAAYTPINVGFAIVQSLTTGNVDAVMGPFKTYETVELRHRGYASGYFRLEEWGIPDYDELIFVTGKAALGEKRDALAAFSATVQEAIDRVRADPETALEIYFKAVPEADRQTEADAFRLTLPYYAHSQRHDPARWQRFADFAYRYGLVKKRIEVTTVLHPW